MKILLKAKKRLAYLFLYIWLNYINKFFLKSKLGDDAGSVTWMDIDKNLNLYASHKDFIELACKLHDAHW